MPTIPYSRHGYLCLVPQSFSKYFKASVRTYVPNRPWDRNNQNRTSNYIVEEKPMWIGEHEGSILIGYGALLTLRRKNPLFTLKQTNKLPKIKPLQPVKIKGLKLRPYQKKGFDRLAKREGGMIELPVATGKTELEIYTAVSAARQANVMFVSPNNTVLDNFRKRCQKYGIPTVDYFDTRGRKLPKSGLIITAIPVSVANDQESKKNKWNLSTVGTLISDECHHLASDTWQGLMIALRKLRRSFGLSATGVLIKDFSYFKQVDLESALVYTATGPLCFSRTPQQLRKHTNIPDVYSIPFQWTNKWVSAYSTDYRRINDVMGRLIPRNELIAKLVKLLDDLQRTSIIPISKKKWGVRIMKATGLKNMVCWYGGGNITDWKGKRITEKRLRDGIHSGKYRHIAATSHADEGLNLPELSTSLLVEGGTPRRTKQRSGRVARKGKLKAAVLNINDIGQVVLEKHSKSREQWITSYYGVSSIKIKSFKELKDYLSGKRTAATDLAD